MKTAEHDKIFSAPLRCKKDGLHEQRIITYMILQKKELKEKNNVYKRTV